MKSCIIQLDLISDSDSRWLHDNFILPNGVRHYVPRYTEIVINGNYFEVETYDIERPGQDKRRTSTRPGRRWRRWGSQHKTRDGLPVKVRRYRIRRSLTAQVLARFDYDRDIRVIELGEDGDQWVVAGTSDAHSAEVAVRKYILAIHGEALEAHIGQSVELGFQYRPDWVWVEVEGAAYDKVLEYGEKYRNNNPFAGFAVTL